MVSATGALGGAATGAEIGSIVPGIGTAIGAGVGGLIGLFGGGGDSSQGATAASSGVFTPEMWQQLLAATQAYMANTEGFYGTPNYAPGGVNVSQTSQKKPSDVKRDAYIQFRLSKGDTQEQAAKKANSIISTPGVSFKDKKGFTEAIKNGQFSNLGLTPGGGISADTEFTPGGASVSNESEALKAFLNNLNTESIGAATGLPSAYAADQQRALAARNMLTGSAMNQVGNINSNGISSSGQADLDSINNYYKNQYSKLFDQSYNEGVGSLINSGFQSSSLANNVFDQSMEAPADYAANAAAKMAAQYNDMLTGQSQRENTALTGTLNAFNTVGGTGAGIGSVFAPNTSGSDFGLFTDPQAAVLAAGIQQDNIANRTNNQALYQTALSMPVDSVQQVGGPTMSSALQSALPLAVGAGKYLAGKFPNTTNKAGTAVSAKLAGLYSGLDNKFSSMFNGGASPGMGAAELLPGATL